ncbi:MAG: site-specific DNA-methyltransferase [Chloroflexi bacterium]|nr:site-specific DNA-methyltransferase [Chloroflexota bacterium]
MARAPRATTARGRPARPQPVLHWPAKAAGPPPSPADLVPVETIGARLPAGNVLGGATHNLLVHGENRGVLAALLATHAEHVDLIYIDPPFATGATFRVPPARAGLDGTLAYQDRWAGGLAGYLQMLYERLPLMWALLKPGGALYVHLDPRVSHYVKVLLDEVCGPTAFQREIVWRIGWVSGYKSRAPNWVRNHDVILYYTKGRPAVFNKEYMPHAVGYRRRGNGRAGPGHPIEDVWNATPAEWALRGVSRLDSIQIKSLSPEKTGFPTQKSESLLRRIVHASSPPDGLVADFFCGSGTTLVVAERLGRRWIGVDVGALAIHIARQRLLALPAARPLALLRATDVPAPAPLVTTRPVQLQVAGRVATVRLGAADGDAGSLACCAVDFEHRPPCFHYDWWCVGSAPGRPTGEGAAATRAYAHAGHYQIAVKQVARAGQEALATFALDLP